MRYAFICIALAATLAWAEEPKSYYIERYPGDGMGMRPKPSKSKSEPTVSREGLPQVGASSTNAVVGKTGVSRAARYTSPRVGSKDYAPSRLPEPKTQTVVTPNRDKKLRPPPKISEKAGLNTLPDATPSERATNATPAGASPSQ